MSEYVLHRDGVDVPQWHVTSADGTAVIGPFSSLEEAIEAAKKTGFSGSACISAPYETKALAPVMCSDASKLVGPNMYRIRLSLKMIDVWLWANPCWLIVIVIAAILITILQAIGTEHQ